MCTALEVRKNYEGCGHPWYGDRWIPEDRRCSKAKRRNKVCGSVSVEYVNNDSSKIPGKCEKCRKKEAEKKDKAADRKREREREQNRDYYNAGVTASGGFFR